MGCHLHDLPCALHLILMLFLFCRFMFTLFKCDSGKIIVAYFWHFYTLNFSFFVLIGCYVWLILLLMHTVHCTLMVTFEDYSKLHLLDSVWYSLTLLYHKNWYLYGVWFISATIYFLVDCSFEFVACCWQALCAKWLGQQGRCSRILSFFYFQCLYLSL